MERDLKMLMQRVQRLGPTEHREIYNIITKNNIGYMQNKNGIFVDLTTIPPETLQEIQMFVNYSFDNTLHLDDYNNRLVECKLNQNYERLPRFNIGYMDKPNQTIVDTVCTTPIDPNESQYKSPLLMDVTNDNRVNIKHVSSEKINSMAENAIPNKVVAMTSISFPLLNSVTKRMTCSKFNQAKKKFAKKKNPKTDFGTTLIRVEEYESF